MARKYCILAVKTLQGNTVLSVEFRLGNAMENTVESRVLKPAGEMEITVRLKITQKLLVCKGGT